MRQPPQTSQTALQRKEKIKIPKMIDNTITFIAVVEFLLFISGAASIIGYGVSADMFTFIGENALAAENTANVSACTLIAGQAFIVLSFLCFIYEYMEVKK